MSIIRDGFQSADLDVPVVLPTLNLDFANSQELDPRITFSRGSIGTFVNKNGLIETASANTPRFDYDPISGECRGLLIEESRQNIVLNSTTLSSHNNSATTEVLTTETTSPDGTFNAYKIIGDSGAKARESIYSNAFTMNANSSYTASVFLKGTETRRYVVMWFDNTPPGSAPTEGPYYGANFFIDLLTGTSTNSSAVKMVSYGNGWYRCSITATVGASNLTNVFFNVSIGSPNGFSDTGNPSIYKYVGDGTSGIYYWGPQVEVGAFPTTYIPTTASTVTRSADNASMTGSNFSSWYNSTEGTLYANAISNANTNHLPGIAALNDSAAPTTYRIDLRYHQGGNSYTFFGGVNGGAGSLTRTSGFLLINPKFVTSYSIQNISFAVNGSLIRANVPIFTPSNLINRLLIGTFDVGNNYYLNGTIKKLTYYPKALPPAQLQYLTQ